jgi:putative colanic acid biosynthesis acetyltransferase WcaF
MKYKLPIKSSIPFKKKFINLIWKFFNIFIFPFTFRGNFIRRRILILFGAKVAKNVRISSTCRIDYPFNLKISENSSIGSDCYLQALDKILIGENVCISDNVSILTGSHDLTSINFKLITDKVIIGNNVWLSYGSCVLKGVEINNNAVIGAFAVVSKNIDVNSIVVGNPAKHISFRKFK